MALRSGIITFQNANNYGAVLQAYALQTTLEKLGHEVSVIDYDSPQMELRQYQSGIFRSFISKYLKLTDEYHKSSDIDIKGYDLVITGSDQVWNPVITGCDPTYFLDFANMNTKKASYAASIGIEGSRLGDFRDFFHINLNRMDAVSLREASQMDFVRDVSGKEISINVDPTLLLDAAEYESSFGVERQVREYIFMYSNNADAKMLDTVNLLSVYTGMPVIAVSRMKENLFMNGSMVYSQVRPEDWLNAIASSKIVITDSFHGLMFSLIFERPFYIYTKIRSNISRITGVLERCDLSDRKLKDLTSIGDISYDIDFSEARKMIKEERSRSVTYLASL